MLLIDKVEQDLSGTGVQSWCERSVCNPGVKDQCLRHSCWAGGLLFFGYRCTLVFYWLHERKIRATQSYFFLLSSLDWGEFISLSGVPSEQQHPTKRKGKQVIQAQRGMVEIITVLFCAPGRTNFLVKRQVKFSLCADSHLAISWEKNYKIQWIIC